ncbi:MAG: hypothetical protein K2M78_08095 [Lachnospiraceae bacterium]|nr:hypothetical protein [Lachnospiraceae bacterium]
MKNKTLKKNKENMITKTAGFITSLTLCIQMMTIMCFAEASADTVVAPINKLKGLFTAIIAAVGGIILLKGIFEAASAYNQGDNSGMAQALKGVAAGLIMAMAGTVLTIMGIS